MNYPWYKLIDDCDSIEQGDFIPNCPIIKPPQNLQEGEGIEIEVQLINSIILSQSCDLVNGKINIVLVCPYQSLKSYIDKLPDAEKSNKALKKRVENLKQGNLPGIHLLNKSEDPNIEDFIVVNFKDVYGIQIDSLKNVVKGLKNRIRLLPPYREHLSQAFARYFMRVGLPSDIDVKEINK